MKAALILGTAIVGVGFMVGELNSGDAVRVVCVYLLSYSLVSIIKA